LNTNRKLQITLGTASIALLAAGCSSSDSAESSPSAQASTAAPTPASPSATGTSADVAGIPKPPDGAKELQNRTENGVHYARYSTTKMTPKEVGSAYAAEVKADGYTVTKQGGGGGGWGGYGGSDYGVEAEKSGAYLSEQAGGESGAKTYFEVCVGADKSAVEKCENQSKDSYSNGS
jgi:hypothetical protein